jgi:multidrug efflux pump subunit AcrA (membrane-fusion protein)
MPVELDVVNAANGLAPGMFAEVTWPVRRPYPTLFVPTSAVARTQERTFVVRVRNGKTEWVDVKTGQVAGDRIEVFGDLHAGDQVAARATDELRPGTPVNARTTPAS